LIDILAISHASLTAVNRAIYRKLAHDGWNIEIVIPEKIRLPAGDVYAAERQDNDPPIHKLVLSSFNPRLYTFKGLFGILNKLNPKIVFLDNDPASRLAVEIGIWTKIHNSALICQSCENMLRQVTASFMTAGVKGIMKTLVIQMLSKLAKRNIKHVFVISFDGIKVFHELGYAGKVSRIPLGFDPGLFYPDEQKRQHIRNSLGLFQPTVAYFGMLRREKGAHLLIQALSGLMDIEWQLLLDNFGLYADPYQEYIKCLINDLGIASRVIFFDAKHEEMPFYINASDIVVAPSITTSVTKEQYGRVISEAMACGRMVVVSDSGTLPEIVDEAGIRFRENDVTALQNALREAINNEGMRRAFGLKAYKRAHSELSIIKQAEILDNIFQNCNYQR
jgi:glycosyltransferase involved in cell wall biosynthesis